MRIKRGATEAFPVKVDESGRVAIPPALRNCLAWISGTAPIEAWLLVESPGRYRLISAEEFEAVPELVSLRTGNVATEADTFPDPLDFEDSEVAAMPTRFLQTDLKPFQQTWRVALPRIAIEMITNETNKTVALLFSGGHLEVWSLESLKAAFSRPLKNILRTD